MLELRSTQTGKIDGKERQIRTYVNSVTGSFVNTYHLRTDRFNNTWWAFEDLFALPFIRRVAAKEVIDLYGQGLSLTDIKTITSQIKATLKSDDREKYEKAYSKVLELENLTENVADPVRQSLGLCTVYLLMNDEGPESWTNQYSSEKMGALSLDPDSMAFFLDWWISKTSSYGQALKGLSQIASMATQFQQTGVPLN